MEWYRQVQFIAAVPMPPEMADEFGTTVNGMWASPEFGDPYVVTDAHQLAGSELSAARSRNDAEMPTDDGSGRLAVHVTRSTHTRWLSSKVISSSVSDNGNEALYE